MTIDWKKEVETRKEDLLADLFALLEIPSVREDDRATKEAPVGPGPKEALLKFLELGKRDGFVTKNVDNLAGHVEYGSGDETLGVFGHVDVVPVGDDGWLTNPFEPTIKDGNLYARGASDDKGPTMAAYYGLKIIKELNLPVQKRIRFIVGTDEESGWMCMDRYLEVEDKPDFGFSPDAEFPIINGEKGNATLSLSFPGDNAGDYILEEFQSGLRANMVPAQATATVLTTSSEAAQNVVKDLSRFISEHPVTGTAKIEGNEVYLGIDGKAAHAQEPKDGINAGTYLSLFLDQYTFDGPAREFLHLAATYFHEDSRGKKLGLAFSDKVMGDLTMNPGLLSYKKNGDAEENQIVLNFRFPQGMTAEQLLEGITSTLALSEDQISLGEHNQNPHYVPADDPLVQTLLNVYEDHTGQKGAEKVIGGGTFGRLLERGVAYGAMFPHSTDTMHQPNEFINVDDLLNAAAIYADAIYRLVK